MDQRVSERAIREIYLPSFEAAVIEGGAGGVMCSFPRINGTYACEHEELLTGILKSEWGFDGAVFPDFPVAQRSIAEAFAAGLDSGVTSQVVAGEGSASAGRFAGATSLREAIGRGLVPAARVEDLVLRRLVAGFRVGTFDHPAAESGDDPSTPEARALAADIVEAGAVLLKNDGTLPLDPSSRRIAVIGTQAGAGAVVVEQGSAYVEPRHLVTAREGLQTRAPTGTTVVYEPGDHGLEGLPAPPAESFPSARRDTGAARRILPGPGHSAGGPPFASRVESSSTSTAHPTWRAAGEKAWAMRWRGSFTAATAAARVKPRGLRLRRVVGRRQVRRTRSTTPISARTPTPRSMRPPDERSTSKFATRRALRSGHRAQPVRCDFRRGATARATRRPTSASRARSVRPPRPTSRSCSRATRSAKAWTGAA